MVIKLELFLEGAGVSSRCHRLLLILGLDLVLHTHWEELLG